MKLVSKQWGTLCQLIQKDLMMKRASYHPQALAGISITFSVYFFLDAREKENEKT